MRESDQSQKKGKRLLFPTLADLALLEALVLMVPAAYVPRAVGTPSMKIPEWTQLLFDTALRSDFLFWSASLAARPVVIRGILATPPGLVENASGADQTRIDEILRLILPVTSRRAGLLNDAAVISSL